MKNVSSGVLIYVFSNAFITTEETIPVLPDYLLEEIVIHIIIDQGRSVFITMVFIDKKIIKVFIV